MSILNATHLKKYYGKDESLVKALDDVNVSVENGQFVAIIGTSGSGKSTLLNMLGGLDIPTEGSVQVENKNLEKLTEEQLTVFRRQRIGFIFQNYNLIPYLTAYENMVLPVRLDGKIEDKKFLKEIVHFLELDGYYVNEHIINLLLEVRGNLRTDKEKMLSDINRFLNLPANEKLLFVIGRRFNIFFMLDDLNNQELHKKAEGALQKILNKNPEVDFTVLCNYIRQSQI